MASSHGGTVLIVDDERSIREYLAEVLRTEGYDCLCFSESLAALAYLAEGRKPADLVLADIRMPGMGGIELLRQCKSIHPKMPVILISGLYELALALDALRAGADDYLKKPVRPNDVVTLVDRYLRSYTQQRKKEVQEALREFLISGDRHPATSRHIREVFRKLGFKRYETFQHSKRVAAYARLLGQQCGLPADELDRLELGALLHDIGKIGIPRNVLMKPGRLTGEEWRVMRVHPNIGHRLLSEIPQLDQEAEIAYGHHEKYNGSGYPRGLRADEIPIGARLFSIVDAFDAITSDRPYRAAQGIAEARREIAEASGSQFDPALVRAFLAIPEEDLAEIQRRYPDAEESRR